MLTVFKIYNKANTVEIRKSAVVLRVVEDVDALIYTYSLTIHSFVPFQQFMSDNQKLDYRGDTSRLCQRQIRG